MENNLIRPELARNVNPFVQVILKDV